LPAEQGLEPVEYLGAVVGPAQRTLAEHRLHELVERGWQGGKVAPVQARHQLGGRGWCDAKERLQIAQGARWIGVRAGQQEVGDCAQRVQIGALIEHCAVERFGRDERWCTDDVRADAKRCECAELDQLHATVWPAPQVARADVAVQQTPRVQQSQCLRGIV
jgi:hypothetical protein